MNTLITMRDRKAQSSRNSAESHGDGNQGDRSFLFKLLDRALLIHEKSAPKLEDRKATQKNSIERATVVSARSKGQPDTNVFRIQIVSAYLWRKEVGLIVCTGVLLNYLGLAISAQTHSVFYLDMTGTAFSAFLLGPWWGAFVGLMTNTINYLVFVDSQVKDKIFPWLLVNMAGGLIWGLMARREGFKRYISSTEDSSKPHLLFLFKYGALVAGALALVGTPLLKAVNQTLSMNTPVGQRLAHLLSGLQTLLTPVLERYGGHLLGGALAWGVPAWLQSWLLTIPDKVISVAVAVGIIKFGFPLFQRELILGTSVNPPPRDNWLSPAIAGVAYAPLFYVLQSRPIYNYGRYWPL
jgi:hypothetical protein